MAARKEIVVVGAGIVGASIAWHLAKAGAHVTVVDSGEAGGVATPASFAWINASWGNPEPYFRLRIRSMAEWKRLAGEVPGIPLGWVGGLCWDMPPAELEAYAVGHGSWGYGIRRVDRAEAARIEPNLVELPDVALHVAEEGAVEPAWTARVLAEDAQRRGAKFLTRTEVTGLLVEGGSVRGVVSSERELRADEVVVAAGVATPRLAATAGVTVPLEHSPGLLVHSKPSAEKFLNGIVIAEGLDMRQTAEGRILASSSFVGADPGPHPEAVAEALFGKVRNALVGGERLEFERYTVGYRPMPVDGFPIIGHTERVGGLYLAVTHSGVTLAPALGLFAAQELLAATNEPLLARYRLARFNSPAAA